MSGTVGQAFRALNQATGRCIRHRFDHGAVIFLDERFHKDRNRAYISKWLRKSIKLYSSFEESMEGLKSFFKDVKVHTGTAANLSQDLKIDCENKKSVDKKKVAKKVNNKTTKSSCCPRKEESNDFLVGETAAGLIRPSLFPGAKCDSLSTKTRNEAAMLNNDKSARVCHEYVNLESDSDKDLRSPTTPLVPSNDLELTIVKETPVMNCSGPQQSSFQPSPVQNYPDSPDFMRSEVPTPEKGIASKTNSTITEPESPWSVNSIVQKRRKIRGLTSARYLHEFRAAAEIPDMFSPLASSVATAKATYRTEETNHLETKCLNQSNVSPFNNSAGSHAPSDLNIDESLQIFCLRCNNPVGLPENNLLIKCSLISTSKAHLLSLQRKTSALSSSSVDVLVTDTTLVNQCVFETSLEGASGQGIWCKEDGCVYNSIFCPFCDVPDNCLGVQVVATDASNIKFQNKILLYQESLYIKKFETENKNGAKDEDLSSLGDSSMVENKNPNVFEKFAYTSPVQGSGGWRNIKRSKMRLPRKV